MTRRHIVTSLLSVVCISAAATTALGDHRRDRHDEIREHAAKLADHSRELYDEVRNHYRGQPFTAQLMSEVLGLYRSARRMTGYADAHSSPVTLEREMTRMENAFQNAEDSLRGISRHHGGHRHVRELAQCIDELVHHIHDDIHDLDDRRYFGGDRGGPGYRYVPPTATGGTGLGPRDWYFGGGGFTVRLGR